jgi:hypothetical protein
LVAIIDCLVSYYSKAFHKNIRYFQLPNIGQYISVLGLALPCFDRSVCHQLMQHAARMAGASVQHKVHLHNLHSSHYIEAKQNVRK